MLEYCLKRVESQDRLDNRSLTPRKNGWTLKAIKLYRPRGLKPRGRPKGRSMGEELPLLPFGNPIGYVPPASCGVC